MLERTEKITAGLPLVHVSDLSHHGDPGEHDRQTSWSGAGTNMSLVGIGSFVLSFALALSHTAKGARASNRKRSMADRPGAPGHSDCCRTADISYPGHRSRSLLLPLVFPFIFSMYQTNIMITALMYVVLGLGLNIVVGLAGLLDLGYVAFYAVGAYCLRPAELPFRLGFWMALPIGGGLGGALRHPARLSGAAPAGRLPGHCHPGLRRDHPADPGKLERVFLRAPAASPTSPARAFSASSCPWSEATIYHLLS